MALFFLSLFFIHRNPGTTLMFWLTTLGIIVLGGIVVFLVLLGKVLSSLKTKDARKYGVVVLATFISFFWLLHDFETVEARLGFSPPERKQVISAPASSSPEVGNSNTPAQTNQPITTTKTVSNQINCTGPDGVTFKTTQKECDEFNAAWGSTSGSNPDPNEIVRCNIHPNCGGGYREMTRSNCNQTICCQTLDGSYSFMSKSQCSAIEANFYADLERDSQAFDDYLLRQDQYYQEEQAKQDQAAADEAARNAELEVKIKQDCFKTADANYQSTLRSCEYQPVHFREGCASTAYQQYLRDKGSCS